MLDLWLCVHSEACPGVRKVGKEKGIFDNFLLTKYIVFVILYFMLSDAYMYKTFLAFILISG